MRANMLVNVHAKSNVSDWGLTGQAASAALDTELTAFSFKFLSSNSYIFTNCMYLSIALS